MIKRAKNLFIIMLSMLMMGGTMQVEEEHVLAQDGQTQEQDTSSDQSQSATRENERNQAKESGESEQTRDQSSNDHAGDHQTVPESSENQPDESEADTTDGPSSADFEAHQTSARHMLNSRLGQLTSSQHEQLLGRINAAKTVNELDSILADMTALINRKTSPTPPTAGEGQSGSSSTRRPEQENESNQPPAADQEAEQGSQPDRPAKEQDSTSDQQESLADAKKKTDQILKRYKGKISTELYNEYEQKFKAAHSTQEINQHVQGFIEQVRKRGPKTGQSLPAAVDVLSDDDAQELSRSEQASEQEQASSDREEPQDLFFKQRLIALIEQSNHSDHIKQRLRDIVLEGNDVAIAEIFIEYPDLREAGEEEKLLSIDQYSTTDEELLEDIVESLETLRVSGVEASRQEAAVTSGDGLPWFVVVAVVALSSGAGAWVYYERFI
ncbi:hypothetical protein FE325_07635 [Dolosigranulum pigrum]|uniref:hypothetical protein n=1 Tax=Dolosigranulum pigrum TaxID=29394 RepID=UPI001AD896DA|nr:hypothetical protein [Dolosigranulum pigrum]QTJ40374.1 hypothetical protein FE325_07635 [Dolosigranulum pigrum]QTJ43783.1 hypothetical protein FE327_07685 [Dolosigranulum pigrum]QTJ47204.1 hypothetical protein FE329_07810 [Dolosigranulum pigrum]QTJ48857.1 hypothetical protein FE330_07680 [Dolosigranulum pigrum]QTJ60715.1 hypothetical protein FE337_07840 [Dolosigranulum pigrum]